MGRRARIPACGRLRVRARPRRRTQHDGAGTLGCAVQPEIGVFVKGLYFREAFERRILHDLLARHDELHVVVAAVRLQLLLLGGNRVVFLHVGEHGVPVDVDAAERERPEVIPVQKSIRLLKTRGEVIVASGMVEGGNQHDQSFRYGCTARKATRSIHPRTAARTQRHCVAMGVETFS